MSDKPVLIYLPGSVLLFERGSFSDRHTCGLLVTIKTCNIRELGAEFKRNSEAQKRLEGDEYPDVDGEEFPSWLVAREYAIPVDYAYIHLGEYVFDPKEIESYE